MTWTAKWRNFLVLWLGLAVSPFSIGGQTACDITCSFRGTSLPDSPRHSPKSEEAFRGCHQRSAGTHGHASADLGDGGPATCLNPKAACDQDNCIVVEIPIAPTVGRGKLSTASLDRIAPSDAVRFEAPLTLRHRPTDSLMRFAAVLAVREILRI